MQRFYKKLPDMESELLFIVKITYCEEKEGLRDDEQN